MGIMTTMSTLVYVEIVMYPDLGHPKPRDTHLGPQAVIICDGVGVHIGIKVLKESIRKLKLNLFTTYTVCAGLQHYRMRRLLSFGPPTYAIQEAYKSGLDR
jgi:hypothetical protein